MARELDYSLDYRRADGAGWIIARGEPEVLRTLAMVPGARAGAAGVGLPASRLAYMVAEVVAAPGAVTEEYKHERALLFSGSELRVEARGALLAAGEERLADMLLPHQWDLLAFALRRSAVFNASEQGTGKTLMTLASLTAWDSRRVLVVCPKEVSGEWGRAMGVLQRAWEFTNLTEGSVARRLAHLQTEARRGYLRHLVTVNYDVLKEARATLSTWQPDLIVADESWKLKTPSAGRTRSAHWLTDHRRPGAERQRRTLLTGTPVGNHAGDLWAQLRTLDQRLAPETYGRWLRTFCELEMVRTSVGQVPKPTGLRDPINLMARLEPVWFRATKETCLRLPPKQRHIIRVELTPQQRALYRAVEADGDAALGRDLALTPPAVRDLRLQQIAGGFRPNPDLAGWRGCEELPCAKLEWLREWAGVHLEPHPTVRALIFCRFNAEVRRIVRALQDMLGGAHVQGVTGDGGPFPLSVSQLDRMKDSFNSRSRQGVQVIVAQTQKLCAGHNLQTAGHVVYFSNDWSYLVRSQSEDRAHRMGMTDGLQYWDLLASGTVDEDVMEALDNKRDFSGRICVETAA